MSRIILYNTLSIACLTKMFSDKSNPKSCDKIIKGSRDGCFSNMLRSELLAKTYLGFDVAALHSISLLSPSHRPLFDA